MFFYRYFIIEKGKCFLFTMRFPIEKKSLMLRFIAYNLDFQSLAVRTNKQQLNLAKLYTNYSNCTVNSHCIAVKSNS